MVNVGGEKLVARILNRRGNRVNLPQPLEPGELGWCLDTKQLYVGINNEYAIPALEIFNGVDRADVDTIMNNRIIEFSTPYVRLQTPTNPTTQNPNEVEVLESLSTIPVSSFVLENNRSTINKLESQIDIINNVRLHLGESNSTNFPMTYLYDWDIEQPTTATATAVLSDGVISTVTLNSGGTGYAVNDVLTVGGGTGAGATLTVTGESGGVITSVSISNGGSGYTVSDALTVTGPGNDDATFTVATITDGKITGVTMTNNGLGYTSAPTINITGDGAGASITATITTDGNGRVNTTTIVNGGSGYTTATLTFSAPTSVAQYSTELYKFTFIVGFSDISLSSISNAQLETVLGDINNGSTYTAYQTIPLLDGNAGLIGTYAGILVLNPVGRFFEDGQLYMPTLRQAANLAGILNKLSPISYNGVVTTKQNVEIMTEYSGELLSDIMTNFLMQNPLSYKLAPSVPFVNIENDGTDVNYASAVLRYDVGDTDVFVIEYSIIDDTQKMVRNGKLTVSVLSDGQFALEDDNTEVRDVSITPIGSGGPDFDFYADYDTGKLYITYRHDFVDPVVLRVYTRKWKSFVV